MVDSDLEYLRERLEAAEFTPVPWEGEDLNLRAFRSKQELIDWYCQPPGVDGEPYRDRGFYCRELAHLSRVIQPRKVVEFGTSLGIGTCMLRWLNPEAKLITVDCSLSSFLPGNECVTIGYLARAQGFRCNFFRGNSWDYAYGDVDLCFIDADHSYAGVSADSERAWRNRSTDHPWAIVWHDHNVRHPGVVEAVRQFCAEHRVLLRAREDSDTVWVQGES